MVARKGWAALVLSVAVALGGCSGQDEPDVVVPSLESPTASATVAADPTPAAPSDAASPAGDPTFLDGIEEAWRVPGTGFRVNQDGTRFLAFDGEHVTLYEVAEEEGEPLWEADCAAAGFMGDRIMCGDTVMNVDSGVVTELPQLGHSYVMGTEEILVTGLPDGVTIAYGEDLTELWRRDGVIGFTSGGENTVLVVFSDTDEIGGLLLSTGEELAGSRTAIEVADGYVVSDDTPQVVGFEWDGAEVFQVGSGMNPLAPVPPLGQKLDLADVQACANLGSLPATAESRTECLVFGGAVIPAEVFSDRVEIGGYSYPGADPRPQLFEDAGHVLVSDTRSATAQVSLYSLGLTNPLWTIPGGIAPKLVADGELLLGGDVGSIIVFRPAR